MLEKLGEYKVMEQIAETRGSIIYRGRDEIRNTPVIIKLLKAQYPSPAETARFRKEYELIRQADIPGVVKPLEMIPYQNTFALVLEHFEGISLKEHVRRRPPSLNDFLAIAVQLAEIIANLHQRHVVHRDIKPQNILINHQKMEVRITDFGFAAEFTGEHAALFSPEAISGTLLYMSPEQTGRMNRSVDYRTDLYSLGVTFYYMLTLRVPFSANDPLEIIHAHIAKTPVPPDEIVPGLPKTLSLIVQKLMAKAPEDRYQNAFGLLHDLCLCREHLNKEGCIPLFELGGQDFALMFDIPQKIFGREQELRMLMQSFDQAAAGGRGVVLVSGHPGIGKSTLIQEIYKPVTARKGYLTRGKYEQLFRDMPYSGLIQACRFLIRQILSEDEKHVERFRERMQRALGPNGKVITDEFPEVELIIGKQPDLPALDPEETRNRFNLMLRRFIQAFSTTEHPLVLFLDDLQWADAASVQIIKSLVIDPEQHHFLLIAAYRDSDIGALGPFLSTMEEIRTEGVPFTTINLPPLAISHVNDLLANFLRCRREISQPLAEIVHAKTGGNPFFINQFLKTLYEDRLLTLDAASGWAWDIAGIAALTVTDNMAARMEQKISNLPAGTLRTLQVCAVVGGHFDLELIADTLDESIDDTLDELTTAIAMGLILRAESGYMFQHDRIREAVYALIPEQERARLHYRIGNRYLDQASGHELREKIFTIVNQLNQGIPLMQRQEEKTNLARLNRMAGDRARNSSAYAAAAAYARIGTELLPGDAWDTEYELSYALSFNCMQCEYLSLHYAEAERLFSIILEHARTPADRARAYNIMIILYATRNQFEEAIKLGMGYFRRIGVHYPEHPTKKDVLLELIKFRLAMRGRTIEDLARQPDIEDEELLEHYQLFMSMGTVSYFVNPDLFVIITLQNARLYLGQGTMESTPIQYIVLAGIFGPGLGLYDVGRRFIEAATQIMTRYPRNKHQGRFYHLQAFLLHHWHHHAREDCDLYRKGHQLCIQYGDLLFGAQSINALTMARIIIGDNLDEIAAELQLHEGFHRWVKDDFVISVYQENLQFLRCLKGQTKSPTSLDDQDFETAAHLKRYRETKNHLGIFYLRLKELRLHYLFGAYAQACEIARDMAALEEVALGNIQVPEFYFYYALSMVALSRQAPARRQMKLRLETGRCIRKMKTWARSCPENFLHKYLLMQAEKAAWMDGREEKAIRLYQEAILSARENTYTQNEAMAAELAAGFYREHHYIDLAKGHAGMALRAYAAWGATGKVEDILARYAGLIEKSDLREKSGSGSLGSETKSLSMETVDLQTVLKISQTISGEIDLERLIARLLELALENAGARVGALLLIHEGALKIRAMVGLDKDQPLPMSIINYVRRTGNHVIMDNALRDETFGQDPIVRERRIQSVLCLPIQEQLNQVGILYLENDLSEKAFTAERIETLKILASQAAISVKNAMLYAERRTAQEQLLAEKERLMVTLRSIGDGVIATTLDGRITLMNKIAEDLTGWPQVLALDRPIEDVFRIFDTQRNISCGNPVSAVIAGEEETPCRNQKSLLFNRDGTQRTIEFSVAPIRDQAQIIGAIIVFRDISERLKIQEELLKNQKLESIGVFAGGIAHDFNNMLTAILGNASLVLGLLPPESKAYERMLMLETASMQAKGLTHQLLTFAKGGNPIKKTVAIVELLKLSTRFALSGTNSKCEMVLDDMLWPVEVDESQISQVINNLMINAAQAMPDGGIITVRAENATLSASGAMPLTPGDYVKISIRDHGIGIPPENLSRIFDPFFTTKPKGNGLGLSSTFSIIQKHNGHITVDSEVGAGTTFTIYLKAAQNSALAEENAHSEAPFQGCGRVLLMDDDAMIRSTGGAMLAELGFEVDLANDGGQAIEKCRQAVGEGRPYTVILMDLTIPGGMGGTECVHAIRALDAKVKIVASSGYANAPVLSDFNRYGFDGILAKPYRIGELKEALAKALKSGTRAEAW